MVDVGGGLVCDATYTYSLTRRVNHSCEPNCRLKVKFSSGWPRLGLFSADKPIKKKSELTFDYNFQLFPGKCAQPCLCGADNCRGYIGSQAKPADSPVRGGTARQCTGENSQRQERYVSFRQKGSRSDPIVIN